MTTVLAFNGSPRARRGNTDRILQPFLEGAAAAGARTETMYLRDLRVQECRGCYSCHMRTPGRCVIEDDMARIAEKMLAAEVLVFASPLYVFSVSALMKALLDRMIVFGSLELAVEGGVVVHPPRYPGKTWTWVVIANAGFPEREHFAPLEDLFRRFARAIGGGGQVRIGGMILRGMGELFSVPAQLPDYRWFFDACRQAGREVVREGAVTEATQRILDRPLLDIGPEEFASLSNFFIRKAAEKARKRDGGEARDEGG
jgi:putative NADPH-quinone reductase